METIAVYWEPRIKTYGFQEFKGLTLLEIGGSHDRLPKIAARLAALSDTNGFELVFVQPGDDNLLHFFFVLREERADSILQRFEIEEKESEPVEMHREHPVDMIFFHGPHFGDRFGIADAAFGCLAKAGAIVMAAACSASSFYLVVRPEQTSLAMECLAETFEAPASLAGHPGKR